MVGVDATHASVTSREALRLSSTGFAGGGKIPSKFTADGDDVSPALVWTEPPAGTGSFALACEDPDAPSGTFVHWLLWNVEPFQRGLPENVPRVPETDQGLRQGTNDFGHVGYGGPSPPRGRPHRYFFRLFALDTRLDLAPGADRNALESAMKGHVVAEGVLIGKYGR